jgi:arylsulfatase A-like enzyme
MPTAAIREGKWKLVGIGVIEGDGLKIGAHWQLHDIENDPTEQVDLSEKHREIADRLLKKLTQEARRTLILPTP